MDRLGCVDVPALPLQLLLREHPDWAGLPAAVVDRDTPQGIVQAVNRQAWRSHVRPGQRYAEGLSIAPDLRAGVVSDAAVKEGVDVIVERLQRLSPEIEPSKEMPGVFWLNAGGMTLLYPSLKDLAETIRADLSKIGFHTTVVIGFSRFGSYAVAKSSSGTVVLDTFHQERELTLRVSLERLGIDPKSLAVLAKLGVKTVGSFLRLPASGIRQRFGPDAHRLHRMAGGKLWAPLVPRPIEEPVEKKTILDEPVTDVVHLIVLIKQLLEPLLVRLAAEGKAVQALHVLLALDTRDSSIETVRPAAPTLEIAVLLDLLQLRLHATRLPAGVREIDLRAEAVEADREQLRLFAAGGKRDLRAAARALARLRAELGEEAVVRARLREGHLPEAGFTWERLTGLSNLTELGQAHPRKVGVRSLIRRIYARPLPLPPRPRNERNDNWLMHGLEFGPVVRCLGPYVVSGGWWINTVHREYHYVETERGDLLWAYYDRRRRRWFLHGKVE
jgi:protein ImuB